MRTPSPRAARRASALFVLVGLAAACGSGSDASLDDPVPTTSSTTTSAPAPTTTVYDGPFAPLTGLPIDSTVLERTALVVKVDNADGSRCDDQSRPQIGIARADVTYEILVEGITRFLAVFHSDVPETVGPVRSARSSDVDLVAQFGGPLFAWSGANANVIADFGKLRGRYLDVGHSSSIGNAFYRTRDKCAPHNLLVNPVDLYDFAAGKDTGVPHPIFSFRDEGEALPPTATPSPGVALSTGQRVEFTWNPARQGWDRTQSGTLHTVLDGEDEVVLSPANVVVLEVAYPSSSTPGSPLAVTVGEGTATVFTAGARIDGTWTRYTDDAAWILLDSAGEVIELTPGKTWVQLAQRGKVAELTP